METTRARLHRLHTALFVALAAFPSEAFTLETAFSSGCHERITVEALARAGWPLGQTEPAATQDDIDLARNLPFRVPAHAGRWTLSLLLGVRNNDLHGFAPTDFQEFAAAQLAEEAQEEHCLRTSTDDDVEGDLLATERCQKFVLERITRALGDVDALDLNETEQVRVALRYQSIDVQVSRFAYRLGQAFHAVQDSYTHTLREPESDAVIHVFNFVEPAVRHDYNVHRDGFGHVSKFDNCDDGDPREADRAERAIVASAAILTALSRPGIDRHERIADASDTVHSLIKYQPGCSPDNEWCHAGSVEATFQSCSTASGLPTALMALFTLGMLRRHRRRSATAVLGGVLLVLAMVSSVARASPVRAYVGGAASFDRTALSADLGVRYAVSDKIHLGVDAELNPWFDLLSADASWGSFNSYFSGTLRWLRSGALTLHTTLRAGISVLLFNAVGAPTGSVGPFLGASVIGLSIELHPDWWLIINPLEIAVAVPSLKGVPLVARQYRLSVGLEYRF